MGMMRGIDPEDAYGLASAVMTGAKIGATANGALTYGASKLGKRMGTKKAAKLKKK